MNRNLLILAFSLHVKLLSAIANPTNLEIFTYEQENPLQSPTQSNPFQSLLRVQKSVPIDSVVDVGCGVVRWLTGDNLPFRYQGVDIVEGVVKANEERFPEYPFVCLDLTEEVPPYADLILCQNCLECLSFFDAYKVLSLLKKSGAKYLLLSTSSEEENIDRGTGLYRRLNFEGFPFCFPPPVEKYEQEDGTFLALWKLESLNTDRLLSLVCPSLTVFTKPLGRPLVWEHPAVIGSLRRGLTKIHPDFSVNPDRFEEVRDHVVVLCDLDAGRMAYGWKEKGKIKRLILGPNIVATPLDANCFVSWPLIDGYLHPSEWTRNAFITIDPTLEGRICTWPAGVDERYWSPRSRFSQKESRTVLLYRKTNFDLCDRVERILKQLGFVVRLLTYGQYKPEDLKAACNEAKFAVFISRSESQGLALAETWSMDVPTLVWDPKGSITYQRQTFSNVSSCPYLSHWTGKRWETEEELIRLIERFDECKEEFQPRRWVCLYMTDKVSTEQLLSHVGGYLKVKMARQNKKI